MRMADGELRRADAIFDGVTVVLAKGTPHESRCLVHFLAVKGLAHLAEVLFPAVMDHQFGGVGVDRYRRGLPGTDPSCWMGMMPRWVRCRWSAGAIRRQLQGQQPS
jgi:hypothetical protein